MEAPDSVMDVKCRRAEIDTSAPIESVKDAVNLFGGIGYWKPQTQIHSKLCHESDFEEQAAELEKEMCEKEKETLEVLQELEKTKSLVEQLKTRIQKETSELNNLAMGTCEPDGAEQLNNKVAGFVGIPSCAPGFVLLELKRAKANLVKTTNDINQLRAAVESYTQRIDKERKALEMTRESLTSNASVVSSLEKDLNDAKEKLKLAKDAYANEASENVDHLSKELERLNAETAEFKKVGEAAKSEVLKAISDIETTKNKLHIAEISLIAAQKIKEAARASEALAITDVKALTNADDESSSESMCKGDDVTLSAKEYSLLKTEAREAEVKYRVKVEDAMFQVDDANLSKMEILRRVEEATEEVKATRMALEEALLRCEVANTGKLILDKALRRSRCEHGHQRHCRWAKKSAKFKNSCQNRRKKVSSLHDLHTDLKSEWSEPATRQTLSIGQILGQKLLHPTEQDENAPGDLPNENAVPNVSLREMLSINKSENVSKSNKVERESGQKQLCMKRKTFGLGRISVLLTKQSKKNKTIPSFKHCTGKANLYHDRLSFG